jgi:hypothetical protein
MISNFCTAPEAAGSNLNTFVSTSNPKAFSLAINEATVSKLLFSHLPLV